MYWPFLKETALTDPLDKAVSQSDIERVKTLLSTKTAQTAIYARYLATSSVSSLFGDTEPSCIPIFRNKTQTFESLPLAEFEDKFKMRYRTHLHFPSRKVFEWVQRRTSKMLFKKQNALINKWSETLYNTRKKETYFALRWISPLLGYGLIAARNIPGLTYVGEYTGKVRRRNRFTDYKSPYIFGYTTCSKSTPYVVDALEEGNLMRFINHSNHPNLTSRFLVRDGVCHIFFFANRLIKKHEQLTYDYGTNYWVKRGEPLLI